jgi:hypothetical protein
VLGGCCAVGLARCGCRLQSLSGCQQQLLSLLVCCWGRLGRLLCGQLPPTGACQRHDEESLPPHPAQDKFLVLALAVSPETRDAPSDMFKTQAAAVRCGPARPSAGLSSAANRAVRPPPPASFCAWVSDLGAECANA